MNRLVAPSVIATSASLAILAGICSAGALSPATEKVPFVGCAADGQVGSVPAPQDKGTAPAVSRSDARDLSYYASNDIGVLAPRGWYCVGLAGSNGSTLIVTPERHSADDFMQSKTPISGAGVQIALRNGGTSGRFEVAQVAARLFPNQSAFVERIVAEGTMPKSDFPVGPYPHDVIRRRTVRTVEFETSPNEKGMGTESLLVANADPIVGVAIMPVDEDNSLVLVDVRLPLDSKRLTSSILQETQRRYDHGRDTGPEPSVNQIYEATRLKHFDQAQKMMDRVLRDHPESAKAHYVQAEIYAAEGHRDLARSELARAEELKPGLPDVNPRSVRQLRITLGLQGN